MCFVYEVVPFIWLLLRYTVQVNVDEWAMKVRVRADVKLYKT